MSRLSIGMFTYSTRPRGSVVHAGHLAEALATAGHDVTLYALDKDGGGFFRSLRVPFVRVPALPAPTDSDALVSQRISEVRTYMLQVKPRHHVLHAQDCLVASGLLAARAALGNPLLCRTVHHVEAFESPFLEACQERSVRAADLLLSVSAATRAAVKQCYARDSSLVSNGVDAARFTQQVDSTALRARLQLPAQAKVVLSVGGVEPRKNTLCMLEGFLRAHAHQPDLHWLIAGGASLFEHAHYRSAFAARLGALAPEQRAAVTQLGVLDDADMPALFAACDVLLHASLQEGFGLCVLEAMAAGRAVVVSRGAPFDEYLDDACALRVDPACPEAIAQGLQQALTRTERLTSAARTRAQQFTWSHSAERHVALYRAALTSPHRTPPGATHHA